MGEQAPGIWRFGNIALDEPRAQLLVSGQPVALDRSSYDILLALMRHSGEVVTKQELLEAGWPGRIVSENSLAKAVSRLRQALGGDAEVLRVVHGYGYRLATNVVFEAQPAAAVAAPPAPGHMHPGDAIHERPGWELVRRLGDEGSTAVWLAGDDQGQHRVFRFAGDEAGVHRIKREIAMARYLRSASEGFAAVVPVLAWNLFEAPFYIETPWLEAGNLVDWARARGGLAEVPLEERLALAIQACEAVAALHEIGVIHQDLKPENMHPVADEHVPGGWRIVLGDPGAVDSTHAAPVHAGDSRLYAAQEVVAGEMPTQRSDVFALGVVVFQLLAGDLRHSLAPGWHEMVGEPLLCEDIRLAAAANPSARRIDARGLGNRLRNLDERKRELELQQARAALDAAKTEQLERDRRRRRLLVAFSGVLAMGLVGTTTMYMAAESSRRQAERQAIQRDAVLAFVTEDVLGQADPYRQPDADASLSLIEAIERAAGEVDAKVKDPASAAAVHAMVASVYFAQDRHADAIDEYERARALYRELGGAHADDLVMVETGLCDVQRIAGNLALAQEACLSALRLATQSGERLAMANLKLGQLRGEQGADGESLALLQPLLESGAFADKPRLRSELYWALGLAERGLGNYQAALSHFESLMAQQEGPAREGTWSAWAHNSLGSVQASIGDYAAAEATLLEARRLFRASQGAGQVEAQMPDIWRGEIRLRLQQWDEAARIQQALIDAWRTSLKPGHPLLLRAQANLAWAQAELGNVAAAGAALHKALSERSTVFERAGDMVAVRAMRWTRVALALGDDAAALHLLGVVDAALPREYPERHPVRAEAECLQSRLALHHRDASQAKKYAIVCREMALEFVPASHPQVREAESLVAAADSGGTEPTPARRESAHFPGGQSGP